LADRKKLSFEEALSRLEKVIARLESNDCGLEDSLALFQEGMELVKLCRDKLAGVERKISILLQETGEFVPFESEADR